MVRTNGMQRAGYNERLFSGGLRGQLHRARFVWFRKTLKRLHCSPDSVLELGCFDGKLIDHMPHLPARYVGYDANWEGGLDIAFVRWAAYPQFSFHACMSPEQMSLSPTVRFDISVAMETLEHVPPSMVDGYLAKLSRHTNQFVFITVPNEKGLVFLLKWSLT